MIHLRLDFDDLRVLSPSPDTFLRASSHDVPPSPLSALYRSSLALATDLYQLTMAQATGHAGVAEREAVFHLFFRRSPVRRRLRDRRRHRAGARLPRPARSFTIRRPRLPRDAARQRRRAAVPPGFLDYLRETLRFTGDVDAVPEGALVFAHEPLLRVRGADPRRRSWSRRRCSRWSTSRPSSPPRPRASAPPPAARRCSSWGCAGPRASTAGSAPRAPRGSAAWRHLQRAGRQALGIPVRGTHAHSWVMFHGDDAEAFRRYAEACPATARSWSTPSTPRPASPHAIEVGRELRARGHRAGGRAPRLRRPRAPVDRGSAASSTPPASRTRASSPPTISTST
jgi:nicotinate phosphoribosyltransferase